MKSLFSFRPEYTEYCRECQQGGEIPVSFGVWFKTAYYYDIVDLLPTGEPFTGSLAFIHCL